MRRVIAIGTAFGLAAAAFGLWVAARAYAQGITPLAAVAGGVACGAGGRLLLRAHGRGWRALLAGWLALLAVAGGQLVVAHVLAAAAARTGACVWRADCLAFAYRRFLDGPFDHAGMALTVLVASLVAGAHAARPARR